MRWSAFAATLVPAEASRLVNLLTAGRGYLYLAVRLSADHADGRLVGQRVAQARRCFVGVQDMLPAADAPGSELDPPPSDRPLPAAALALAQHAARQLAAVVQTDGELSHLHQHLAATIGYLQHAHQCT